MAHYEFLPLCDVLFNIISLASYFCDIVFDLVMGYALLQRGRLMWSAVTVGFVLFSLMVSQAVSLRWYLRALAAKIDDKGGKMSTAKKVMSFSVVVLHVSQCGILWRYFKLFVPVDLRCVKYEVRDLCILRLVHAFCESAPLLLVQLYIFMNESEPSREFRDLNIISMSLSLFSVCWALASFSKNVRMHNVHKLVLTWLGVIFQLAWRLGTVSSRALCLTAYASVYAHWLLLVIFLHWISMFLWLISPNNLFHKEKMSKLRKTVLCSIVAFVYVFAYVNLQQLHHRHKMALFYIVMSVENLVLMYSWYSSTTSERSLPLVTLLLFLSGLVFMFLYYRYFHVRRLKYEAGGRLSNTNTMSPPSLKDCGENGIHGSVESRRIPQRCIPQVQVQPSSKSTRYRYCGGGSSHCGGIPGVFNCRFSNPYGMRKKKKPTSFVPPPSMETNNTSNAQQQGSSLVPFWCRPVSSQSSDNGNHVDLQDKHDGKKRHQLSELRSLEEEMLRGKMSSRPTDDSPILLAPHQYLHEDTAQYLQDGSKSPPQYLRDGGQSPPQYLRDGGQSPPQYLRDGGQSPPQYLRDGGKSPPQYIRDGGKSPPQYIRDGGGKSPAQYLRDGGKSPAQYLRDGGKSPAQYLRDGGKSPAQYLRDGGKSPAQYLRDGGKSPAQYLRDGGKSPAQYLIDDGQYMDSGSQYIRDGGQSPPQYVREEGNYHREDSKYMRGDKSGQQYLREDEKNGPPVPPYTLPRQSRVTPRVTPKLRPLRSPHNYMAPANSSDGDVDSADDDSECWHTTIPQIPFRLQQSRVKHETKL